MKDLGYQLPKGNTKIADIRYFWPIILSLIFTLSIGIPNNALAENRLSNLKGDLIAELEDNRIIHLKSGDTIPRGALLTLGKNSSATIHCDWGSEVPMLKTDNIVSINSLCAKPRSRDVVRGYW